MVEQVAKANGIVIGKWYSEPEAAHFLKIDLSTLKRHRRDGLVEHVSLGPRSVRYTGLQVIKIILRGLGNGQVSQ